MTWKPASFDSDKTHPSAIKNYPASPLRGSLGAIIPGGEDGPDRCTVSASRRLLTRLRRALREERQRGKAGHWSYDLNRHIALAEVHKTEVSRLEALTGRSYSRALGASTAAGSRVPSPDR